MANKKGTTNSKTVPNQHAGSATSTDTVKKTAAIESWQTLHAKASMALPIGRNKKHHQSEKKKSNKKFKEQLVKYTQANSKCVHGFSVKGAATSLTYVPKHFINDYDLVFRSSTENKFIIINGEFFKKIGNRNLAFLLCFIHNFAMLILFPWTAATIRIHYLSGRILNITRDGKRPYVKAKVNNYR